MTAIAHRSAACEVTFGREGLRSGAVTRRCSLRATEDGWSLLAPDGKVIFRGRGLTSRRECLEIARELGVMVVIT